MLLSGRVRSGLGDFSRWIDKFEGAYFRATGVHLFPGTLNVELESEFSMPEACLRLEKADLGGAVAVSLVPCRINGRPAFILRTDANDEGVGPHPRSIVEVAADVKLRDLFGLQDGDPVAIEVDA